MSGLVENLPDAEYHGRKDSLSVSGAKLLLPPSCPALFRWRQDNPQPHKAVFDFGSAAHKAVLGMGRPVRYIDADTWATKAAKADRDEVYAADEIPLLRKDEGVIEGMVAALRAHPLAAALFAPGSGKPEVSLFAEDADSGVNLRGRLDWLPASRNGRLIVPDYKTAAKADVDSFSKSVANFSYEMQDAWYRDLVVALGLADDVSFVFVAQEREAPYLVNVIELDADAVAIGRRRNRKAINTFKACTESGVWPGYSDDVELISLPVWYQRQNEDIHA